METLQVIESLNEAIRIISDARRGHLAGGSFAIWNIANHAENHLDKQIKELLAPAPYCCAVCGRNDADENTHKSVCENDGGRTAVGNTPTCEDCSQPADYCACEN